MKTMNIYKILGAFALTASLCACDKIAEDERFIKVDMPETGRNVLIEEFTGQFCVNCPDGHEMINNIKSVYGEKVISVGIHAGQLAWDDVKNGGLKTPDGDAYANKWNVLSYPSIVVNHAGNPISNMAQWQDAVQKVLGQTVRVEYNVEASISADGKRIEVKSTVLPNENIDARYNVWVTESNITAFQQDMSAAGYDLNYVHNHVYRASMTGKDGEEMKADANVTSAQTDHIDIDPSWNLDNINIVAFIYDGNGVIQVVETTPKR